MHILEKPNNKKKLNNTGRKELARLREKPIKPEWQE